MIDLQSILLDPGWALDCTTVLQKCMSLSARVEWLSYQAMRVSAELSAVLLM